jgi:glycosyltransferase involved in cell wall biosynthesis
MHILHDDSRDAASRARVDRAVESLERETGVRWRVLRREVKGGGKAGVLNAVLEMTSGEHDVFLLCDNDSYADDPDLVARALPHFADERVAVVQCRNMTRVMPGEVGFTAYLAGAIEIFDVFMTGLYRLLWTPFVGHNAFLRTRAVVEAGGATPGFFADDIDLTVRLNLRGLRVLYRRDLRMSEGHPPNYRAFCLRAQKWASGCGQVIRAHLWRVLSSRAYSPREKAGFLLFCGFYATQGAMLVYMLLVFVIIPLASEEMWRANIRTLLIATMIPASIFVAVAVYLRTEGRHLPFWRTLTACAGTYGSTDFWTLRGLLRGLSGRAGRWVPTNTIAGRQNAGVAWAHFALGVVCLAVPAWKQPVLLLCPMTWIFAAKYLFVPAVEQYYRPIIKPLPAAARAPAGAWCAAVAAALGALACTNDDALAQAKVEVREGRLWIDGEAPVIKGVHYSPWRPGTGPGRSEYPADELVAEDLDLIAGLNANTILVYDPPARVLDLAWARRLRVIYVFHVPWWRVAEGEAEALGEEAAATVARVKDRPAVIAWMLGNEAPAWVLDGMGAQGLREALSTMRRAVRRADPSRPVCYGNWPLTATDDLDRDMDIVTYNVYPFYPTEVPALGYGRFIRERIMIHARGRPVIISEFGVNTLEVSEARQAEVLVECWRGLLDAGAQGGVVFAFADEWWKNYDNPVRAPDWWRRQDAPDDHLTADQDPEEHYGVFDAYRRPKPAAHAVRAVFADTEAARFPALAARWGPAAAIVAGVGAAVAMYVRGVFRRRRTTEVA